MDFVYDNLYDEYLAEEEIIKARMAKNSVDPDVIRMAHGHEVKAIDIRNTQMEQVKKKFEEYSDRVKGEKK